MSRFTASLAFLSFLTLAGRGEFIDAPSLENLWGSQTIAIVESKDLSLTHPAASPESQGIAKNGTFLKGAKTAPVEFSYHTPPVPRCERYLLFLSENAGKLEANGVGSILGLNQEWPKTNDPLRTPESAGRLLETLFLNEPQLASSLLDGLLLAKAPPQFLGGISEDVRKYMRKNTNPLADLAAFNVLVRGSGIAPFSTERLPDFASALEKCEGFELLYGTMLQSSLLTWVKANASRENYGILAEFATHQSKEIRASTLGAIRKYATPENIGAVIGIFMEDSDIKVRYGCIQNLCKAYGEGIPSVDNFESHSTEVIDHWKDRIRSFPSLPK